jgi:hypothetical protein
LRKALILLLFLLPASVMLLSCGGSPSGGTTTSGIKNRAFVTNNVSSGTGAAGVYIVNADTDVRATTSPISVGSAPVMMVLTPNRAQTLVFSGNGTQFSDNQFSIVNNATEAVASHLTFGTGPQGMTESFVVSPDSSTGYVAVPNAPVTAQPSPGAVEIVSLGSGTVTATIACPLQNPNPPNPGTISCVWPSTVPQGFNQPYRYLSIGNTGSRILAFSEGADTGPDSVPNVVAVITPSNAGTTNPTITFVTGFDHPVAAFFSSDDSTAYVLNCGAECGGTQASIQQLNLTDNTLGSKAAICTVDNTQTTQCAGSTFLISGSTVYIAGTPFSAGGGPSLLCSAGTTTTQATYCGMLTTFDLNTMSVTNTNDAPIVITDGYHNRMAMAANGQLFIGARTCTEISTTETRGCLSIYNTLPATTVGSVPPGGVLIPPQNGDATGIQPIADRTVVYVIQGQGVPQGGSLFIYDATIDALENNPNDPNNPGHINGLVGNFFDVKAVDF